jgi:hypothetical protein
MVNVSAIPTVTNYQEFTPTLYLAGDLGKSACKFLHWVSEGEFQPLWLGSDVVEGVSDSALRKFDAAGDLAEAAWLSLGEHHILVGNSATGYGSSFAADKICIAAYQVAAALALAATKAGLKEYHAVLSLAVPLNEFRHRSEIDRRLKEIGGGFVFCGQPQRFTVTASFYPEGTGLYLLHKKEREQTTATPYTRRVVVLMMGHRNLSVLVFEGGKLNANLSQTSDMLGFWNCFKADATAAGIREADYNSLLAAITTGHPQQLSKVDGGLKDFSVAVETIKQGTLRRLEVFCRDNVIDLLVGSTQTDVLIGGGVAHILRSSLRDYFAGLGLADQLYYADAVGGRLLTLAEQTHNAHADLARPMRFADVYGLAQALAGKVQRGR